MASKTYLVNQESFIGDVLYRAGDKVTFDFGDAEIGDNLTELSGKTGTTPEAIAAEARENALNHPEGHIGMPVGPNQAMTHEQGAALNALGPDADMTPQEVSAAVATEMKPKK